MFLSFFSISFFAVDPASTLAPGAEGTPVSASSTYMS
jgi:hypothetical protein